MQFKIIATDLDGTIAQNDAVSPETWKILERAKKDGFTIILVTGRRLNDINQIRPFDELCEAIVAEDGAAIFFPSTNSVILPFGQVAPEVILELESLKIPFDKGMAIASTWTPHDKAIAEVLANTGYAAHMEFNKGAVMIMPPGATKGSGLSIAVRELGYSIHNVVCFGDAENDRSLFEQSELAVAVSNATKSIKELADISLVESNGKGVRNFIEHVGWQDTSIHESQTKSTNPFGAKKAKKFSAQSIDFYHEKPWHLWCQRFRKILVEWLAG